MSRSVATLTKPLRRSIESGHPWVFGRALSLPAGLRAGQPVEIRDREGAVAVGYADPDAPIAIRVLDLDTTADLGEPWARQRARQCARARAGDPRLAATDARRWIHGENDEMPGLVVDEYAGTAVVVFDGPGAARFWRRRLDAILDGLADGGAHLARVWARQRGEAARAARGEVPPEAIVIAENGARFEVDVHHGQKTGFFLDQRDNRVEVGQLAAGASVLNLFSYTGGFSVLAALGGASAVTSVDIAPAAIETAARCLELSGVDPAAHELVCGDVFEVLEGYRRAGRRFDVVVCDPPSFARSEKARGRALEAYRRLNHLALAAVVPGGVLVSASCSSHVTETDLIDVVGRVGREARRAVRIRAVRGAASDHPVKAGFPEGRYLSCLFVFCE